MSVCVTLSVRRYGCVPTEWLLAKYAAPEVVDLLAALNTGHEGGCGTVHANSAVDVPARLEALALAAGLGRDALHSQVAAGLDAVIHIERDSNGVRRVSGIHTLHRAQNGLVESFPAVSFRCGRCADRVSRREAGSPVGDR